MKTQIHKYRYINIKVKNEEASVQAVPDEEKWGGNKNEIRTF